MRDEGGIRDEDEVDAQQKKYQFDAGGKGLFIRQNFSLKM